MDFSVIIPAYNAERTIKLCVGSILGQELRASLVGEVLVVDDGSTDETPDILAAMSSEEHIALRVITHPQNRGRAAARNSGLQEASGNILFFLDSDMSAEPGYLKSHFAYYTSDKSISGIINKYVPGAEVPVNKFTRYLYRKSRGAAQVGEGGRVPTHQVLIGCTSMRRTVYEQVGGFDDNLKAYGGEDTEFAFRISKQTESTFIYTEQTVLQHHHYRTLEKTQELLYEYGKKSLPYLIEKYPDLAPHVGLESMEFRIDSNYSRMKRKFLLSKWMERAARLFYRLVPPPVSHIFVRYLLGVHLLRGFFAATDST